MNDRNKIRDIANNCLAVRTRIASRDITRLYDEHLRSLGLRITQLSVLVAIGHFGEASPTEIGQALHLDRSTLSRTLQRLKDKGWLEEGTAIDDRSRPVKLTVEGRALLRQAYPRWQAAQKEAASVLEKQVSLG